MNFDESGTKHKISSNQDTSKVSNLVEIVRTRDAQAPLTARTGVFVSRIRRARDISVLLKILGKISPMPVTLSHLRRISRRKIGDEFLVEVIVCRESERRALETKADWLETAAAYELELTLRSVPAIAPDTREVRDELNKVWPCNWRANDTFCPVTDDEISGLESCMRVAAREAIAASSRGCEAVGAVLYDPRRQEILCRAGPSNKRPLGHAIMECIGVFSQRQAVAKRKRSEAGVRSEDDTLVDSYLCTGLDLIVTSEPCVMCAMALLHSRIGRVFYAIPNRSNGALVSNIGLHVDSRLNHHFRVYQGLCCHEIASMKRTIDAEAQICCREGL